MKRILIGLLVALALPGLLVAQAKPAATAAAPSGQSLILEFVDGNDLIVTIGDKTLQYGAGITDGDTVPVGATLKTGPSTTVELKIKPNGTILKLAKSTTFTVQTVAQGAGEKNAFALVAGKVRAIAAKGGQYDLKSQTAVCGVRGTDFSFNVEPGAKEQLMVANGKVEMQKLDSTGSPFGDIVGVGAGEFADAMASVFQAAKFTAEMFQAEFGDMKFQKLIETDVPGHAEEIGAAPAAPAEPAAPVDTGKVEVKPVTAQEAASTLAEGASKLTKSDVESGLVKWLREVMGMELGSVTINGETWSKAVVQPNFNFGKVKFGLYLPIIYSSNMFDPKDWYHPNGNDEWSFGFQNDPDDPTKTLWETKPLQAGLDFASDFALKIKFFELGRQLDDPFFIKIGNLNDLTLGHGLIMRNYANDTEFPSVRRVGLNIGMDFGVVGLEALSNDLADVSNGIYGARFYLRPIPGFKLAFGISGVADIEPFAAYKAADGTNAEAASYGDPMLLGAGIDLDLPIVTSDLLGLRLYADAAADTTWLQSVPTIPAYSGLKTGLQTQLIYNSNNVINNWGAAGGLMGHLLMIDFRLEYRYYTGIFAPSLFDSTYDKTRAAKAIQYVDYAASADTLTTAKSVMGVYGEGGFSFLRDKLNFRFGYMWPWDQTITIENGDFKQYLLDQINATSDEFHAKLIVRKGLIPIFDVAGEIFYDKRNLAQDLAGVNGRTFKFLDPYTTFGGELVIPVPKTPNLDVAAIFSAVPDGEALGTDGLPKLVPTISFETRLHF